MENSVKLHKERTCHAESLVPGVYSVRVVGAVEDKD